MSWGTDLWDQISNLEKHTEKGIDFVEKFSHFLKERQRIENDYAGALKKLVKNSYPKKKEEDDYKIYTSQNAFKNILSEMNSIANQHELIGEYLINNVLKDVQTLIAEMRSERKKYLQDFKQEDNNLEKSIKKMESTKNTYKHAHDNWVGAKVTYEKANDDMNQTKLQVEKCRTTMNTKNAIKCECKDNYILQLDNTNKEQRDFYFTKIPQIFNKIQEMDETRTQRLGEFYQSYAQGHRQVIPLISNCLDTMTSEAERVDPSKDSASTLDKYKSGLIPPDDFPMQDLDEGDMNPNDPNADTVSLNSVSSSNGVQAMAHKKKTKRGLLGIARKKEEPKEDFSHLPPNQQSKKLKEKIDELNSQIESEVKSKEGLMRMRVVYTNTPSLGDVGSVDRQLTEIGKKLDALRMDLNKYERFMGLSPYKNNSLPSNYLSHAEGKGGSTPQGTPHSTPQPKAKSPSNNKSESERLPPSGAETPQTVTEHDGILSAGEPTSPGWGGQNSFDETEEPIGKCRALYEFKPDDDNLLGMKQFEELDVIEKDSGDGWTRVRRGDEEGYVPTSYIEHL